MPHFSPISWIITGFIFYVLLFMFVALFWWLQNVSFPYNLEIKSSDFNFNWKWM